MKNYIKLLFLGCIVFYTNTYSQNLPVGTLPMQYNSSFAGSAGDSRVVTNAGLYYVNNDFYIENYGYSFNASYDKFIEKIGSGIGVSVGHYLSSSAYYSAIYPSSIEEKYEFRGSGTDVSLAIAPKLSIKGKYTISPSLDLSFSTGQSINTSDPDWDDSRRESLSSRMGILFNSPNYYVGYSFRLFSHTKKQANLSSPSFYSTLQLGYSYQRHKDSKFAIIPQLVLPIVGKTEFPDRGYVIKGGVRWPAYNLGFRYDQYLISVFNQIEDGFPSGFQLGWQNKNIRILLSNDFYRFTGIYEANLTFRYIFHKEKTHFYNVF